MAEVYAGKNDLAGNDVLVRGRVVKFSANVMGKNWIHLKDGTGEQGKNDVTITTADIVEIGDLILVRGELVAIPAIPISDSRASRSRIPGNVIAHRSGEVCVGLLSLDRERIACTGTATRTGWAVA